MSRGHAYTWTCLSGTSVSPPHPCIQSPVLTGKRRGGMSVVLRAKPGLTHPPSPRVWAGTLLPASCCNMQVPGPSSAGRGLLSLSHHPCCPSGSVHRNGPSSPCTPGKRATILSPHPVMMQGSWAASHARMCMGGTAVPIQSCQGQSLCIAQLGGLEM